MAAWTVRQLVERHVPGDRLSAFLDDELADEDALHAARHIADCERCLRELSSLRSIRDALRALPSLQAPVLAAGLQARSQQLSRWARRIKLVVVACVVPVLLGAGVYVLGDDVGEVEPTADAEALREQGSWCRARCHAATTS